MEQSQSLTVVDDPFSQHVMPFQSAQMLPPTGIPKKRKRKQEVLEEEEYVDALSRIIERDYFPQLAAAKLNSYGGEEPIEINGLTVDSFFDKFTSYDNNSFEELQQKSVEEHRRKHAWLYELPPDDGTGKHRISGMMMLYYLGNQVISAEQREKMDAILNGPENVGDNRPNGSQPGRFRVRNQLMFPPELAVSEDICRMHENVSNATHAAIGGSIEGNYKGILPGQQVPQGLMIVDGEAGAEQRVGKNLLTNEKVKSLNNQANNLTALQQALVRYNKRLASGNQSDTRNEKVIQRSNTALPATSSSSFSAEGTPTLTAAQLLSWQHSQQAKNSVTIMATRRFPGLVLEEPHTPSLRSSAAESGSCSSGSVAGDGASDCADLYPGYPGGYPGGYMRKPKEYHTVPMSPCPVPGEGALQSMTPLFTWGSVEGTPVLLERFPEPPSSSSGRSFTGGHAAAGGGVGSGGTGSAAASASHDRYMKELQERALWEEENGQPRFTLRPTTQREMLARSMDTKNQASKSAGSSRQQRSSHSTSSRPGGTKTPHSERTVRTAANTSSTSSTSTSTRTHDIDDDASVAQRRAYYAAAAEQITETASVAGSVASVSTNRRAAGSGYGSSNMSARERLARLTPAARALAEKLNKRVATPLGGLCPMIFVAVILLARLIVARCYNFNDSRTWEEMLPCRDGIKLHTRIAIPRNDSGAKYTTIVDRSPYGYSDLEWLADLYLPAGFATVGQDFRGTQTSEGKFSIWHMDANDSEDLGDWIVQQSWSNGQIYTFGASADGLGAFTTVLNKPSWLKAQYFIWTSSIGYDVFFPGGTMLFDLINSWIHHTVDGSWADVCYEDIIKNEMKTDWWDPVDLTGHYGLVDYPAAFWAGWYDLFLLGNLAAFDGYNTQSDPAVRNTATLVVDPLGHCQDAAQFFPQDLVQGRSLLAFMQSLEVFSIHPVARTDVKNVTFYVMSSNDTAGLATANYWTTLETFPTPTMTHYYAHADGTATTSPPGDTEVDRTAYVYDPQDPVPTVGGANLHPPCGPLDQQSIDRRADVLVFQTPVQDEALFMTGPLFAHLFVGSDAVDTDFMVRISDVYPTGEVRLIQDSAVRMRWREGGLTPVYMKPNEVYEVTASLWNTSYAIAPGHALRVSVSSSNYPRFSVNANTGELLVQNSTYSPVFVASNVLYHSAQYPSSVVLPVVLKQDLPELTNIKAQFSRAYPHIDAESLLKGHPDLLGELIAKRVPSKPL